MSFYWAKMVRLVEDINKQREANELEREKERRRVPKTLSVSPLFLSPFALSGQIPSLKSIFYPRKKKNLGDKGGRTRLTHSAKKRKDRLIFQVKCFFLIPNFPWFLFLKRYVFAFVLTIRDLNPRSLHIYTTCGRIYYITIK